MYQVFAIRQVCEKYQVKGKEVCWALLDLEKACDTIKLRGMWQMLRVYRVVKKLLPAVQFYAESRA